MTYVLCVIYISNKAQYLKNEERYGKTIHGVPLSFQEFFQIRQTYFSFLIHFKCVLFFIWGEGGGGRRAVNIEICELIFEDFKMQSSSVIIRHVSEKVGSHVVATQRILTVFNGGW